MSNLVTIHSLNGTEAITTTVERIIQELIALGELETVMQEIIKAGALDRVIELVKLLRVMSTAKRLGDDAAHKAASEKYEAVFGAAIDNLKMGEVVTVQAVNAPLSNSRPVAPQRSNTKPCKACGTPIVFLTNDGKWIAVNASSVKDGEKEYNSATHERHMFSDCNKVKKESKPNKFTRPNGVTAEDQAKLFD